MSTDHDTISMLRDAAQRYTSDHYGFLARGKLLEQGQAYSAQAWRDYADFGWLALRLPEDEGGIDADAAAIGVLMESAGSRLLLEPLLASAVLGTGLLLRQGSAAQRAAWLPKLADGSVKLAFAHEDDARSPCVWRDGRLDGAKTGVLQGDIADDVIVSARNEAGETVLCIVAAGELVRSNYRLVDGRGAANLRFEGSRAELLGESGPPARDAIALALDEAAVALCAEACGVISSLVAISCDYLKIRKQFGKPIGSNQVLQHRMVDMYLLQEEARALTDAAQQALALAPPLADRERVVSGARAYIGAAVRRVANEAVQLHGGLGITEELDVSHYFRRAMTIDSLFGGRDLHMARFMAQSQPAEHAKQAVHAAHAAKTGEAPCVPM
ncbi:acyl-CoA dehydrogenase family protein [Pseudoduganella sp. LjRoot289]|uniref:acyl-CoA dehydrogenase family protein n=1 Tax=Pseudoduganella sp. LjRoot289 TaxID=3342314 RepID=UPI003ECEB1EA